MKPVTFRVMLATSLIGMALARPGAPLVAVFHAQATGCPTKDVDHDGWTDLIVVGFPVAMVAPYCLIWSKNRLRENFRPSISVAPQ